MKKVKSERMLRRHTLSVVFSPWIRLELSSSVSEVKWKVLVKKQLQRTDERKIKYKRSWFYINKELTSLT